MPRYVFFLLLIHSAINAGDTSQYELIGFSADGKYVAFERYGVYDGSAFPYCEIFIVDVAKNDYPVPPLRHVIEESPTEHDARIEAKKDAKSLLQQFGIIDRNTGTKVWEWGRDMELKEATFQDRELWLKAILTEENVDMECVAGQAKMFRLELEYKDGAAMTLQQDTGLPESRGCVYAYCIMAVYTYLTSP
jgi:predicted secreted protein